MSLKKYMLFLCILSSAYSACSVQDSLLELEQQSEQCIAQDQQQCEPTTLSQRVMNTIKQEQPLWLRLALVFFLGFLLSLTPCMYPMIPITIGILQAQGKRSLIVNIMQSLCYVLGLSTTFALFGLAAGCLGPICGQLLSSPWFIIGLVVLLAYFAGSMLGLYEIKVPRGLQKNISLKGGSGLTAFALGAASGTFASPCVSPGLALLLTMVATMGNTLLGFLLLFVFGIGLGVPLLLIGTLSSSTAFLPRAGLWMVEVKRLFGVLMLGACAYYATYAAPVWLVYLLSAAVLMLLGIFYIRHALTLHSYFWSVINRIAGIAFIAVACCCVYQGVLEKYIHMHGSIEQSTVWLTDYPLALHQAKEDNKLLFIDFWAPYCPVCITINKKVLTNTPLLKTLQDKAVLLKVNVADNQDFDNAALLKEFGFVGVPAFVLIDPTTKKVYKQWGAELSSVSIDSLIQDIRSINA